MKIDLLLLLLQVRQLIMTLFQARRAQASVQVLREILQDSQKSMVPRNLFNSWAIKTFQSATDYWTFRKMVY